MNYLTEVNNWLRNKHIKPPNEWISACTNWCKNRNSGISLNTLRDEVYQQWLLADLELTNSSCLPPALFSNEEYNLEGTFALQINFMYDLSQSAYSQLSKLNGKLNENVAISAVPEEPLPPWELKPTRNLLLQLSDGSNKIEAFEFKPIPALNLALHPGTKVLIKGPVECMNGQLLLTPTNIQVLGGGIEELMETNSQINVLTRVLRAKGLLNDTPVPLVPEQNIPEPPDFDNEEFLENIDFNQLDRQVEARLSQTPQEEEEEIDELEAIQNMVLQETISRNYTPRSTKPAKREESFEDLFDDVDEEVLNEHFQMQDQLPEPKLPEPAKIKKALYGIDAAPYTYLAEIKKNPVPNKLMTIKGFIISLTSRLECSTGVWSLKGILTDGSDSQEVIFHDKVLTELIGLKATEVLKMREQSFKNPEIKVTLSQKMRNCQQRIINLNCLLKLEYKAGSYFLVDIEEMTVKHLQELKNRIQLA